MFKPKMYKSNNLEAYHLISIDGGSILYEGRVEYSENELFKDEQGKAYYLVISDIGGSSPYYVEVEPEGKPIPPAEDKKEKAISDLVMASPREFQAGEPQKAVVAESADGPEPANEATPTANEAAPAGNEEPPKHAEGPQTAEENEPAKVPPPVVQSDTCFESPEEPAAGSELYPGIRRETTAAKPETVPPQPSTTGEAQAAVKALASLGDRKPPKKKKIATLPIILALVLAVIIIAAAGIFIYKPDLASRLNLPIVSHPASTPTPVPSPTPSPEQTATPGPTVTIPPTSGVLTDGPSDIDRNLLAIAPAIDSNDTSVRSFARDNSNSTGTSNSTLAMACDLFDNVNNKWTLTGDHDTPQDASDGIRTLSGSRADYSILMAAIAEADGMDSRVVAVYNEGLKSYVYYPEIMVAANDSAYGDAKAYLLARYNVTDPYGQTDGTEHWLSLSPGKYPGMFVESTYGKAINSRKEISPV